MIKEDFEDRIKSLTLSPEEKFKAEQTNELIEMINKLRINIHGR